jgi:hypothetical protein
VTLVILVSHTTVDGGRRMGGYVVTYGDGQLEFVMAVAQ